MTTFTQSQGARSSAQLTMSTLASGTYIASSSVDLGASIPLDVTIEVEATSGSSPSGNKQLVVFGQLSLDGTNFGSGPTSLTATTDEADLHWIGTLPMNSAGTHRKFFSLSNLPVARYIKFIAKNDLGVALTSGYIYKADITGVGT